MNDDPRRLFCRQYIPVLQMIKDDPDLKQACGEYSAYSRENPHRSVMRYLMRHFMKDAYRAGIVVTDYMEIVEGGGLQDEVGEPSDEVLAALTPEQLLGCIAWHFRRDHFSEGSLISASIAEGHMLRMLEALAEKAGYIDPDQ